MIGIGAAAVGAAIGAPRLRLSEPAPPAAKPEPHDERASRVAPATEEVRALFGSLGEGSAISSHWRIESLHAVRSGAIPVVMSTIYGGRFAVEIFRDDPSGPPPIARAGGLALKLVNRGDGGSRTDELRGLGVMALGRALEARLADGAPVPSGLQTFAERMARDPHGAFDVPV